MSTKWRIYCDTEAGWQEQWSDTSLTECPNDAGHSVNTNSVQEIEKSIEVLRIPISYNIRSATTTQYQRVTKFQYNPKIHNVFRSAKAIAYKDGNMTSFDVQMFDATNQLEICSVNLTNTVEETVSSLGPISNIPTSESIFEINIKRNGGNNSSTIYIDELVLYS
jgi:hypothetical protein